MSKYILFVLMTVISILAWLIFLVPQSYQLYTSFEKTKNEKTYYVTKTTELLDELNKTNLNNNVLRYTDDTVMVSLNKFEFHQMMKNPKMSRYIHHYKKFVEAPMVSIP